MGEYGEEAVMARGLILAQQELEVCGESGNGGMRHNLE